MRARGTDDAIMAKASMYVCHFQAFDTECEMRLPKKSYSYALVSKCFDFVRSECARYERLFSTYLDISNISRVNCARGRETPVSPETADLVARSLEYCRRYPSVFDISIGAVTRLWDFHKGRYHHADSVEVRNANAHTSFRGVHVNREANTITLDNPESKLDLGASAKGYIADKICSRLVESGVSCGILDFGGAVSLLGEDPDGRPWMGSIADPRTGFDSSKPPIVRLEGRNLAIATSSVVLRSFELEGRLYHHIIDPLTGMPRGTDLLCASIISSSAFKADCLSTIALSIGMTEAQKLISHEGVAGVLLQEDGTLYLSPQLRKTAQGNTLQARSIERTL